MGHARVHLERPARARRGRGVARDLPRGVPRGHGGAGGHPRRHRRQPPDHWVGGLADPTLHAIVVLFARDVAERERVRESITRYLSQIGGVRVLSSLDLDAISPRASRAFRLPRSTLRGAHRGDRGEPHARLGPAVKAGEFFLGYADESGLAAGAARAGDPVAQRQLRGVPADRGARRRLSRLPPPARADAGRAGAHRREADGALAQRRAARPRARRRTTPRSAPTCSARTTSTTTKMDPHGYALPGRRAHPAHEPAGHRREHRAAPDDPARRHVRSAAARRRAATTARSEGSPPSSGARAWSGSSSSR